MPLIPLTFITFLVLKLTEVIDWSWWWVTAPLWGGACLFGGIMLMLMLFATTVAKGAGNFLCAMEKEISK